MIRMQNEKSVLMIHDLGVTNGETASGFVDTLDYDYCVIDVLTTTSDATTKVTTLDLGEGVVSNAYTTIPAFLGGTAFTIPESDTSDPIILARFNVDASKYEQFLRLRIAVTTTQGITAIAKLGYKDESDPSTAAGLGLPTGVLVTA